MPHSLLAETVETAQDLNRYWIWAAIALFGAIILIIVVATIRKKYFPTEERKDAIPAGFGISQLKDLYDQGLLSDDEFNAAKAKIVAQSHAAFMAQDKGKNKGKTQKDDTRNEAKKDAGTGTQDRLESD